MNLTDFSIQVLKSIAETRALGLDPSGVQVILCVEQKQSSSSSVFIYRPSSDFDFSTLLQHSAITITGAEQE